MLNCPMEATLSLIGGECKLIILWHPIKELLHYIELQRFIPGATPKVLFQQFHDLEALDMISREVMPEKPSRTIYSLAELSKGIILVLGVMYTWGTDRLSGLDMKAPCQKQERG